MGENGFQAFPEAEKKELQVLVHLPPSLLGVDGRTAYEKSNNCISKNDYKSFLEHIQLRVKDFCKLTRPNSSTPTTQ